MPKKPIEAGDWVFWYDGLWQVESVGNENVPKKYMQGHFGVRPHGFKVATLMPLNVPEHVQRWYQNDVKYHGGVVVGSLKRINPLSALKRGHLE